jgi:hypothetical protein
MAENNKNSQNQLKPVNITKFNRGDPYCFFFIFFLILFVIYRWMYRKFKQKPLLLNILVFAFELTSGESRPHKYPFKAGLDETAIPDPLIGE